MLMMGRASLQREESEAAGKAPTSGRAYEYWEWALQRQRAETRITGSRMRLIVKKPSSVGVRELRGH